MSHTNESCRIWLLGLCGAMMEEEEDRYQVRCMCVLMSQESSQVRMSHESCHIRMSHESCLTYERVMSHKGVGCVRRDDGCE